MTNIIRIKEPRYHDSVALVALYHVERGDNIIRIMKGAYKGDYPMHSSVIVAQPTGHMTSKRGHRIIMKEVPLDLLTKEGR